jgi:hypothetical protein
VAVPTRVALGWLLAVSLSASIARADAPSKLRPPLQQDFDHCALWAEDHGNLALDGTLRFELLIRRSGNVYAVFVSNQGSIEDRAFERCLTAQGPLWVFGAVPVDYQRGFDVSFVHASSSDLMGTSGQSSMSGRARAFLPNFDDVPEPRPINEKVAQETLEIPDWATTSERANAEVTVHLYKQGLEHAREALRQDANDPTALRALARGLAESGGDLVEARAAAERLVALDQQSVNGHEALLRVCLSAKDDACALREWPKAVHAPDLMPRSRLLAELQGLTQAAADRLKAAAARRDQAAPADPCAAEKGEEAQALCVVKRCLDEGSLEYAKQLSAQNGLSYTAGDWRAKPVAPGKLLVTRPIEPTPAAPGQPPPQGDRHDALWLVNLGDQYVMRPTNVEARQITVRHNRCTARVVTGPSLGKP